MMSYFHIVYDIAYDIDDKSFVLLIDRIPNAKHTLDLSRRMIEATRKIENPIFSVGGGF